MYLSLGHSTTDTRQIYQTKQATEKVKRIVYDETKNRNEVDLPTQIRSYPMSASISRQRQVKDSPTTKAMNSTNSTFIIKKSKCF